MDPLIFEYLSLLTVIAYAFLTFNYSQLLVKIKVKVTTLHSILLFFSILIWTLSFQRAIPLLVIYLCLYFTFLGIYKVCFEGTLSMFMFASGNFVFHLLCIKGIIVPFYAFLMNTSMYTIMYDSLYHSIATSILFTSSCLFLQVFRKFFPEEKIKLLIRNHSQLKLITSFQIAINIALIGATMVYFYNYTFSWLIIYHSMLSITMMLVFYLLFKYSISVCIQQAFQVTEITLTNQIQSQLEQYDIQSKYIRDLRRLKHDYSNQIKGLKYILDSGNIMQAQDYIRDLDVEITHVNNIYKQFSNNVLIDAILQDVNLKAKNLNIEFDAYVKIDTLPISNLQACTIFSNLMNNALEACEKIDEGHKFIHIQSFESNNLWVIHQTNSFNGEILQINGKLQTLKVDKLHHGLGVESIRGIIDDNGGELDISHSSPKNVFQIHIVLPLDNPHTSKKT